MTINPNLDSLLEPQQPEAPPSEIEGLDSVQVAGPLSALKGLLKGAAKTADDVPAPKVEVPPRVEPALAEPPPMPAATPPPAPKPVMRKPPDPNRATGQPADVQQRITPEVSQDVLERARMREVIEPEPLGKPPEEILNYLRTGLPDDANLFLDEAAKAAGVKVPDVVHMADVHAQLRADGFSAKDVDWVLNHSDNKGAMKRVAMARELLVVAAKNAQDIARQVELNPTPELVTQYTQAVTFLGQVARGVKNIQTDYARALSIMRAVPEGDVRALEEFLNAQGGIDSIVAHAGKLAKIDLADQRALKRMADMAEKSIWSKAKDIWVTTWINGLVSSPITHAKNIVGNSLFMATQVPERFAAGLIGKMRGADVGDRVEMDEAVSMVRGLVAGNIHGFKAGWQAFMANAPVTTSGSKIAESGATITNFGQHLGLGGMVGRAADVYGHAVTLPGRALMAEDEMFKTWGYYMELYAQASRHGAVSREAALQAGKSVDEAAEIEKNTIHSILSDPPDDITAASWNTSKYVTFTENLEKGTVARYFQDLAADNVVARMFLPFVRTPVNIAATALERTPFAPFTKHFREGWEAGGTARDIAIARMGVGTSLLVTGGYLASIGRITGAGPGDRGQREALERSGWQPYAIVFEKGETNAATREVLERYGRITQWGDKYTWSYQGIEPLGTILALGGNFADYARYQDNVDLVEQVGYGLTFGLANYAMELPYLQGMSEFVTALTGYGTGVITPDTVKRMVTALSKTATNFIIGGSPAGIWSGAVATAERFYDPTASDIKAPPGTKPMERGIIEAFNRYKSRVPGLSDSLPPKTNRWGEDIKYGEGALYETVSPIRLKEVDQKPVDEVWLKYDLPRAQPSRDVSWSGNKSMDGVRIELTTEEFNAMKKYYAWEVRDGAGRNIQRQLVAATEDKRVWDRLSFGDQQAKLIEIDDVAMNVARVWIVNNSPYARDIQERFRQQKMKVDEYGRYSDEVRR